MSNVKLIGQSLDEDNEKKFSQMDQSPFKGKVLLNRAVILKEFLAPFESSHRDKEGATWTLLSTEAFQELINIAERGQVENEKRSEEIEKIQKRGLIGFPNHRQSLSI